MKPRPLRLKHDKLSAVALRETITNMPYARFKLFVRSENFTPIGILTKKTNIMDSSTGRMRLYAHGTCLDGKRIYEPLDWKNSLTGQLESCVVFENDYMIITARKSSDPSDDKNNFHWLILNPYAHQQMKNTQDRIIASQSTIQRLQKELNEARETANFYKEQADIIGNELRNLKKRYLVMSKEYSELQSISHYLYNRVLKERSGNLMSESMLRTQLQQAGKTGEIKGLAGEYSSFNPGEIMKLASKEYQDIARGLASLHIESPELMMDKKLENIKNLLEASYEKGAMKKEEPESPVKPPEVKK